MLFNSLAFLLGFLPLAWALHAVAARFAPRWRLPTLLGLSLVFYGWWDWRFLPFLLASATLNWFSAEAFFRTRRKAWLYSAIALDLAALGLFKYALFAADMAADLFGVSVPRLTLALPLGVSFFTFHHVMYLVDAGRGGAPRMSWTLYALYIGFFPQVLSGPLVRWREILWQFELDPFRAGWTRRAAQGLTLLTIGLAKKLFIADALAPDTQSAFDLAARGAVPLETAWQGVLGYAFQIYFDFSGYTDMALGLGLLFGVALPQNFLAPYRATSLRDFWRDWHVTLSRFLRDYLYIPLGGSRNGLARQLAALFLTMTLGGLWHGAGYNFLIWGALHGAGLGVGVLWRRAGLATPALVGWALTFAFVCLAWVFFRAATLDQALTIFAGLVAPPSPDAVFRWRTLALAFAIAVFGPTTWEFTQTMRPRRWLAIALGLVALVALLQLGDDQGYEFIYFKF
jgi:D-alanyl-lipoteichoic acid acyltransferase DltB (MBOAT superfamily)